MQFAHPEFLYFLLLFVPFIGLLIYNYKRKKFLLGRFISPLAYSKLGVRGGRELDVFKTTLISLSLIFFIFALAAPQWGERYENIDIHGLELVFLMDTSNSMLAEDMRPNRLEVAKHLIMNVVDALQSDYVSLINFAGVAYVQCPLTLDYDAFKLMADASTISPSEEQGTDLGRAFRVALKTLAASKSKTKLMILITDGEDQEGKWQEYIPQVKDQGVVVFTVGVGAREGAPIPIKNEAGEVTGWKKDKKGNIVKTRLDETTLHEIASRLGGQYFRVTDAGSIGKFVDKLKQFERQYLSKKVKLMKIHRFHYPLIIGIILLIIELLLSERKLRWVESE